MQYSIHTKEFKVIKENTIQHFISPSGFRLTVADITSAALEAQRIHHLPSLEAVILGKIMAGSMILANDFKNKEGISIVWKTKTPLGTIHAESFETQYVRGYIENPNVDLKTDTPENESALISNHGILYVIRYSLLRTPYTSSVPLSSKSISQCFSDYLNQSDQTLSSLQTEASLNADGSIKYVRAYMSQFLPQGDMKKWNYYFKNHTYDLFSNNEKDSNSLAWLLKNDDFTLLHEAPVSYHCTCSEDKFRRALIMLPQKDKDSLLKDDHLEIRCQYCGKVYNIFRETLKKWFNEKEDPHA